MCNAGISGFKTNHSLRATRLYQSGVGEQLVTERTGHRSIDDVLCSVQNLFLSTNETKDWGPNVLRVSEA